ncbi:MAG: hypothetical protein KBC64_06770 [Simkaniaceae bacterium]|nr:hypothetical protein [Simkaniaceae bacterium]
MKVGPPSLPPPIESRKGTSPKKGFKEIYKQKVKEEPKEPPFNLFLPPPKLEIPPEEYLIELITTITTAIENDLISTELKVHGTLIRIEQFNTQPGHLHIQIMTEGSQFDLLRSHLGQLDLALKTALPHVSCHLAPIQVHQTKNRFKNSPSSDMVRTKWTNGQKKFTP